jgi:hypothetical protein
MLKEAIKRRKPDFSESYYGFRAFGNLLDEAQTRGLLEIGREEKSGTYVFRNNSVTVLPEPAPSEPAVDTVPLPVLPLAAMPTSEEVQEVDEAAAEHSDSSAAPEGQRKARSRRKPVDKSVKRTRGEKVTKNVPTAEEDLPEAAEVGAFVDDSRPHEQIAPSEPEQSPLAAEASVIAAETAGEAAAEQTVGSLVERDGENAEPARKTPTRNRRPRKPKAVVESA